MNEKPIYEFDAVIIKHPDMDAAYIDVPLNVPEVSEKTCVGTRYFCGEPYDGRCADENSRHIIGVRKDIRQKWQTALVIQSCHAEEGDRIL